MTQGSCLPPETNPSSLGASGSSRMVSSRLLLVAPPVEAGCQQVRTLEWRAGLTIQAVRVAFAVLQNAFHALKKKQNPEYWPFVSALPRLGDPPVMEGEKQNVRTGVFRGRVLPTM